MQLPHSVYCESGAGKRPTSQNVYFYASYTGRKSSLFGPFVKSTNANSLKSATFYPLYNHDKINFQRGGTNKYKLKLSSVQLEFEADLFWTWRHYLK